MWRYLLCRQVVIIATTKSYWKHLQSSYSRVNKIKCRMGPRKQKQIADSLTKSSDFDDWETTDALCQYLSDIPGSYSVDRFADNFNKKVPTFNSKYWYPNTSQVNAFRVTWENENLVPSVHLVSRVIIHLAETKLHRILIVLHWPSASLWSCLRKRLTNTFVFATDYKIFANPQNCVKLGNNKSSVIDSTPKKYILVCKLDFRHNFKTFKQQN